MITRFGTLILLVSCLPGCTQHHDDMFEVSGTIYCDGSPLKSGTISFIPIDGNAATAGAIIRDGLYSVKVSKGNFRVAISSPTEVKREKIYNTPDSPEIAVTREAIPAVYNKKSEITKVVERPEHNVDFEVKTKAG